MMEPMNAVMTVATVPFAIASIGLYASNIWSKKPNQVKWAAIGVGAATITTIAGAEWLPHVIAGISIGAYASVIWGKWVNRHAEIKVILLALLMAVILGAGWVLFPIGVISFIYLMTSGSFQDPARLKRKWHGTVRDPQRVPAARRFGIPQDDSYEPPAPQAAPQAAPQPAPPVLTQLADDPRLSDTARNKVLWIDNNAKKTLDYLRRSGTEASRSVFAVEQIRDDYTPTAVRAYLALPAETADSREIADGRTGADLLDSQLDTLLRALDELRDEAADNTATQLLVHQQFLDNKFGHRGDDLQL